MTDHRDNALLAALDEATYAAMKPHLSAVTLERGQMLAETYGTVEQVYFPHSGMVSSTVDLRGGAAIETGMIGKDGQFGGWNALDRSPSISHVLVQVGGAASVIGANKFRSIAVEHHHMREITMRYEQFFLSQAQQTAACNAVHSVEQRACKWFLHLNTLVGAEFFLTQEFLAQMMGVRRTSVTEVATSLQTAGMISYSRGNIRILDLKRIRERACECHESIRTHHDVLFGNAKQRQL